MRFLLPLLLLPLLLAPGCNQEQAPPTQAGPPYAVDPEPHNVILISVDTLRPDHLGTFGYERDTGPNMDLFAKKSVVFSQAQSQASWTTPSHASLFTSLYPSVLNISRWPDPGKINEDVYTIADVLRDQGYATAAFTEAGMVSTKFGFGQGFDLVRERYQRIEQSVPECLQWIDNQKGKPFHVFLHTYDVHRYAPPAEYQNRYFPDYEGPITPGKELAVGLQRFFDYKKVTDPIDQKMIVALYDEEILYVDHWLGRFFEGLQARGLMENTVIILTSDHGEEFWEHGRTGHGYTNFDEVLWVPLMIYHPRIPHGERDGLVRLLDILPTIADMVGAPARTEWQGQSLFPLMKDESGTPVRFSYAELGHLPYVSVQSGPWKLVRLLSNKKLTGKASEDRLYNLEADPRETRDVSAENAETFKKLVKLLETLMKTNYTLSQDFKAGKADIDAELREQLDGLGYTSGKR